MNVQATIIYYHKVTDYNQVVSDDYPKIGTGGHEALCKMATDSNKRDFDSDILYTFSFTFCVLTENKIFIVLFGILCGTAVNFGQIANSDNKSTRESTASIHTNTS